METRIIQMLSLAQHALLQKVEKESLHKSRDQMPQILGKNMAHFKKYLHDKQISSFDQEISPDHLKATQDQFNVDKIEHLMHHPVGTDGVIISSDKRIVDGHHRAIASLLNGDKLIKCLEINLPIQQLLLILQDYSRVEFKGV